MNIDSLDIRTANGSARHRDLRFHRSGLWTKQVAQVPALSGIMLLNCNADTRPNWEDFREEAFRRSVGRPPWFCVWPNTGIAAFSLPPTPIVSVRFQCAQVWVDPRGRLDQEFDFAWRSELGFEKGLGDRRLPGRHPMDLACTQVRSQTCFLHGDDNASAHVTFRRCHQIWLVPDWNGRQVSIIACEYILDLEPSGGPSRKRRPALKIQTMAAPGLLPTTH